MSSLQIPPVIKDDWNRLRIIVDKLRHLRLGSDSDVTFISLTLEDLLTDTITIKDSDGNIIIYGDATEFYFAAPTAVAIADGMPIGLLLAITYKT